jgi:hypothetical protein
MPLNINNLTAGTPVTFNAQTSSQRMVFDSSTVAFRIVNNTTGIVTVSEENSDGFICTVDPGATAFGLMQNAILVEAQYPGSVTLTPYTWVPVSSGGSNTFTAQQIFKAATTTTAAGVFQATGTISAIPAVDANAIAQFQGTEAVASHVVWDSAAAPAHVYFRRSNGTYASPTAIANADILGSVQWQGRGATTFGSTVQAQIRAAASQTFTDAAKGTGLEFYVTAIGAATNSIGLRLSNGTLLTGHNAEFFGTLFLKNNTGINFESVAAVSESVLSITSGNNVQLTSPTASGNITITNRATAGQIQITAGTSTGVITLATGGATRLTIGSTGTSTFANPVITQSEFQIQGAAGTTRALFLRTVGSTRWTLEANAVAESGGNVGSNFVITRYDDAGASLGTALTITRSNALATFSRALVSGVATLTDAASIALDASLGNHFRVTLAGNRTMAAPTNPTDGQRIAIEVIQDATGSRTLTLTTGALGFAFGTDIPSITLTTTANARDFIECLYNSTSQRWYVVRFVKGY